MWRGFHPDSSPSVRRREIALHIVEGRLRVFIVQRRIVIVMCPPSSDPGLPALCSDGNFAFTQVEEGEREVLRRCASSQSAKCNGSGECARAPDLKISDDDDEEEDLERALASKKLKRALLVCFFFMLLEIVGGSLAGSLAILSDAAHLLSDVAGFAISLLALRASQWSATPLHTFGYLRLEVLGALVSVQIIWITTGYIVYEAVEKLFLGTQLVDGRLMCFIAILGVAVNLVMILSLGHGHDHHGVACGGHSRFSFHKHGHGNGDLEDGQCLSHEQKKHVYHAVQHKDHHGEDNSTMLKGLKYSHRDEKINNQEEFVTLVSGSVPLSDEVEQCHNEVRICCAGPHHVQSSSNEENHNINLRGAYLHAVGDLIQSVGVVITGIVIWVKPEWQFIDLLCALFFSIIVVSTTFRLMKELLLILMESTPRDVDIEAVNKGLLAIQGVVAVRQLHVWALTNRTNVVTCHLHIKPIAGGAQAKEILQTATRFCTIDQKMKHVTIQIEDISSSEFQHRNPLGME